MKLLGQQNSINVRKVLWTCAELKLTPELEDWGGLTRETCDRDFLAINPKGLVPVLIDDDLVLTESNTICRYLATRERRTDLLPDAPKQRAIVEAWMDWQATDLNTVWREAFMGKVRQHPEFEDADRQLQSVHGWNAAMSSLNMHLMGSGQYVCGDMFTLADIVLALSTNRWELTPMDRPALPAVASWMNRLASRPGFKEYCQNGIP
ncbi:glutathione S-transferase family protein [Shimia sp. NS0008-38b]|uniref:glutathione S-transferase family protein n=1 Tax=Shimia sp. NS0008-38b TaxID=3127653 RepID=UPI00310B69C9